MIKNKKIVLNAFIVFLLGWLLGSFVRKESLTDRQQYYLWQEKCIKKGSILAMNELMKDPVTEQMLYAVVMANKYDNTEALNFFGSGFMITYIMDNKRVDSLSLKLKENYLWRGVKKKDLSCIYQLSDMYKNYKWIHKDKILIDSLNKIEEYVDNK